MDYLIECVILLIRFRKTTLMVIFPVKNSIKKGGMKMKTAEQSPLIKEILKHENLQNNLSSRGTDKLFCKFLKHENLQNNLSVPRLVEKILSRKEGVMTATGAVCSTTGKYTGRSPHDKFIVKDEISDKYVE